MVPTRKHNQHINIKLALPAACASLIMTFADPVYASFYADDECALMIISLRDTDAVRQYIERMPDRRKVRAFHSETGLYGIAADIVKSAEARANIEQWRASGFIPADAYCASNTRFLAEIDWRTGNKILQRPAQGSTPAASVPQSNNDYVALLDIVPDGYAREAAEVAIRNRPNFADSSFFVSWGCGSGCSTGGVLDSETRRWKELPFAVHRDFDQEEPTLKYSVDSNVITATGWLNEDDLGVFQYQWDGKEFSATEGQPFREASVNPPSQPAAISQAPFDDSTYEGKPCRYGINEGAAAPVTQADFINHGDGTVTHRKTGLMWARCQIGKFFRPDHPIGYPYCDIGDESILRSTYQRATEEAGRLSIAGKTGWRLPTLTEIQSLQETSCRDGFIFNNDVFPGSSMQAYWTTDEHQTTSTTPSRVTFQSQNGYVGHMGERASESTFVVRD